MSPRKNKKKKKTPDELIMEWFTCDSSLHPEYYGQFCLCAGCRPENYCIPIDDGGGCVICEGPVTECGGPTAEEEEEDEINRYA
ncbi:MAG: hypothetical protein WC473_03555 [Patescibacteria group bacterium]|jgi:hypothetical protein